MVQVFDGDGVQHEPVGPWRFTWDAPYVKDNFCEARYLNVMCGEVDVCAIDFETDQMVDEMLVDGCDALLTRMEDEVTKLVITKGHHRLLEQWPGFGMSLRTFLVQSIAKFVPGFG